VAPEPKGKALYVAVFAQTGNFRPLINNKRNNGYVIGTVESVHAKEKNWTIAYIWWKNMWEIVTRNGGGEAGWLPYKYACLGEQ
jgi:hypothetical protein